MNSVDDFALREGYDSSSRKGPTDIGLSPEPVATPPRLPDPQDLAMLVKREPAKCSGGWSLSFERHADLAINAGRCLPQLQWAAYSPVRPKALALSLLAFTTGYVGDQSMTLITGSLSAFHRT